ncbi:hypothetical protein [Actinoplanes awajinensis]|nr:hypothetical protein [Actinoplanes awajinensis]
MIEVLRAATAKRDLAVADRATPHDATPHDATPSGAIPQDPAPQPGGATGGSLLLRTKKRWRTLSRRTRMTTGGVAAVVAVLLVWAAVGGDGGDQGPAVRAVAEDVSVVPAPSVSPPGEVVPQAATHPVRSADDLELVCGSTYYPTAPKFAGKAVHPIAISARGRLDMDQRSSRTLARVALGGSAVARRAWAPAVTRVQLVACLDLIGGSAKLKDCKSDEAKKPVLPLMVGRYKLTVYEAATRRKVTETTLEGADKACPWVVMTGSDRTVYSQVTDDQLFRVLRKPVIQGASVSVQPKKRS